MMAVDLRPYLAAARSHPPVHSGRRRRVVLRWHAPDIARLDALRERYTGLLRLCLERRASFTALFLLFCLGSLLLLPLLGPELLLLAPPGLWRSAPFGVPPPVGPS